MVCLIDGLPNCTSTVRPPSSYPCRTHGRSRPPLHKACACIRARFHRLRECGGIRTTCAGRTADECRSFAATDNTTGELCRCRIVLLNKDNKCCILNHPQPLDYLYNSMRCTSPMVLLGIIEYNDIFKPVERHIQIKTSRLIVVTSTERPTPNITFFPCKVFF